mmetsp:Transcript_50199/g.141531  ORF Transcript_50199/g.141531 Transcript_50199/m.141531 type:complete len:433 (-) Transcript_50199:659-1957(-)
MHSAAPLGGPAERKRTGHPLECKLHRRQRSGCERPDPTALPRRRRLAVLDRRRRRAGGRALRPGAAPGRGVAERAGLVRPDPGFARGGPQWEPGDAPGPAARPGRAAAAARVLLGLRPPRTVARTPRARSAGRLGQGVRVPRRALATRADQNHEERTGLDVPRVPRRPAPGDNPRGALLVLRQGRVLEVRGDPLQVPLPPGHLRGPSGLRRVGRRAARPDLLVHLRRARGARRVVRLDPRPLRRPLGGVRLRPAPGGDAAEADPQPDAHGLRVGVPAPAAPPRGHRGVRRGRARGGRPRVPAGLHEGAGHARAGLPAGAAVRGLPGAALGQGAGHGPRRRHRRAGDVDPARLVPGLRRGEVPRAHRCRVPGRAVPRLRHRGAAEAAHGLRGLHPPRRAPDPPGGAAQGRPGVRRLPEPSEARACCRGSLGQD